MRFPVNLLKERVQRLIATLVLFVGLSVCPLLEAQPFLSEEHYFPYCEGLGVIIREDSQDIPVILYHDSQGATFIYGDLSAGTARKFTIPITIHPASSVGYVIKDMKVADDTCYFCGARVISDQEGPSPQADSVGIVGKFYLPAAGFGVTANYQLQIVPKTKCLNRMTVYNNNQSRMIAMIGVSDSVVRCDCLAMIKTTTPGGLWEYDLRVCTDPDERFTDIGYNVKTLVIASRRTGTDEEKYVYLRSTSVDGVVYNSDCNGLNSRHRFHPDVATPANNEHYTMKHWQNADIRMCMVPWETEVHLAYECIVEDPLSPKVNATALTRVETTFYPMKMDNIQIIKECDTVPGSLCDVKYVYDTYGTTNGNAVAILHRAESMDHKTVVEYPMGLIFDYGLSYWALIQWSKIRRIMSLPVYSGNKIRLGGHYLPTTNRLVHLKQNRQFLDDKQWCINNDKSGACK